MNAHSRISFISFISFLFFSFAFLLLEKTTREHRANANARNRIARPRAR